MEPKKEEAHFKKSLEVSKKNPYLNIKNWKETDFGKFFNNKDASKETETENKVTKLRGRKNDKTKEKSTKKFNEIPVIAHNSEKPSIVIEELNAGKIYPSIYHFNENSQEAPRGGQVGKNKKKLNTNKKYNEIPIVAHNSEKPSIAIEEMSSGKLYSNISTSVNTLSLNNQTSNKLRGKKNLKSKKYIDIPIIAHNSDKPSIIIEEMNAGKSHSTMPVTNYKGGIIQQNKQPSTKLRNIKKNLKNKKYKEIPIIPHDSEKPSTVIEEMNSGKYYSTIPATNYKSYQPLKNKLKCVKKNLVKNSKYADIPIIAHNSEKPSCVTEETNTGKFYSNIRTSTTDYKEANFQKNKLKEKKNLKNGKYICIPIVAHESEKPSLVFEESNTGRFYSNIRTSKTNYKEENLQKSKLKGKKNYKNSKFKDIAIIEHDSQGPSKVFEEINAGNMYKSFQTSITEYKEDKRKKVKCEKKSKIIVHDSEKPSFVFEQINAGKLYSNIQTSVTDKRLKNLSKYKPLPIVVHNSEKPTFVFEEANTGILLSLQHNI